MSAGKETLMVAWPAILQALAFGVVVGEVLLPSLGLLTVLSLGLFGYSWYFILTELPGWCAWAYGAIDVALSPFAVKLAFHLMGKSPISHQGDLGKGSGLEALDAILSQHIGKECVVEMPLRPSGKIRIGDEILEAESPGEFIDRGASVRVVSVAGSRIKVEPC
jgi:membrane-bound serine protease (ClpP class)